MSTDKVLLINPWICDFAAYDLWLKPWGLLKISSILKNSGKEVHFVDALDRHHPLLGASAEDRSDGTGKYHSEEIAKPPAVKNVPRRYKRYGLPLEAFKKALPDKKMDAVLISSGMTYWYPGAFEAIRIVRERYDGAAVILGGTYATLCYDHAAAKSGADHVVKNGEAEKLSSLLGGGIDLSYRNILDEDIDYGWYASPAYGVLRLSLGCPFDCSYCAQKKLSPGFMLKDSDKAVKELSSLYARGIKKFAYYDDAFLYDREYFKLYLEKVIKEGIKAEFYTPNGLHARFLDLATAELMHETGFRDPVLSLEFGSDGSARRAHSKVTRDEVAAAASNLLKAGYSKGGFTVYLLLGAPGCGLDEVEEGMEFVHSLGGSISLSEFSPVPGTKMAEELGLDLSEPLLQNNSIYPAIPQADIPRVLALKLKATRLNASLS